MMRWKIVVVLFCTAVLLVNAGLVLSQSSANFQLNWTTVAGGASDSQSADYRVEATIGQPLAHTASTSSSYRVGGGFWLPFAGGPTLPSLDTHLYLPVILHGN
jgi:hypothetical protein